MKLLIWSPRVNLGGGKRLLAQLAPAIARQPGIAHVCLAVPPNTFDLDQLNPGHHLPLDLLLLPPSPAQRFIERDANVFGLPGTRPLRAYLRRRWLPATLEQLERRRLRRAAAGFDAVYVFWPQGRRFHDLGIPIVCTYQDTTSIDFPEILGGAAALAERINAESWLRGARRFVVSSHAVRERLTALFGAQLTADIQVIHHNILPDVPRAHDVPRLSHLPPRCLVYPANLNAHKNHDTLLIAWARFARRRACPLVLVGEGMEVLRPGWDMARNTYWRHDRLLGLVGRLGLRHGEDYFALGYVSDDDLYAIMRHAHALVMPSLSEGGGSYPVEEALTYGVPVVCADIPVMREHLAARTARVGWFDPLSPDSLTRALDDLFAHYDAYKASALTAMGDPRPTWDDIGAQYARVLREAISAPTSAV